MAASDNPIPPKGLIWRSNTTFILTTVTVGLFTDLFLYSLIVPLIPFILTERIHIPTQHVQFWTSVLLACYSGVQIISSLPIGMLADKLAARRTPFLVGLSALLASTLLLYLGRAIELLIVARVLQGLSAAVVWTIGFAIVVDTVGRKRLGRTMGGIFSFINAGQLIAPVLGGILYKTVGEGAVFSLEFALIGVDFVMRLVVIEKKTAAKYVVESHLSRTGDQDIQEDEADETSPLLPSPDSIAKEDYAQWRIPENLPWWSFKSPVIYCFSNPRLLIALGLTFVQALILGAFDSTLTIEAQSLFGFDALRAGLLFIPLALPCLILGPLVGRGVDKYGPKPFAVFGLAYFTVPLFLLRIPHKGGNAEITKFVIILALNSVGLSFAGSPASVEQAYVFEHYNKVNGGVFGNEGPYGRLYAISGVVFSGGLTIGPIIGGTLRHHVGYGNMNAIVAGLCGIYCILCFIYLGGPSATLKRWSAASST
ncbi:MFS transporter-like protein [Bisporella sp. PMI_857]|nr:MFS transporter-like protein [Bisporella sp. PMI_857]